MIFVVAAHAVGVRGANAHRTADLYRRRDAPLLQSLFRL